MGFELSRVTERSSFRPYTSKQVGDTGPAESARRSNSRASRSSFSGARGTISVADPGPGSGAFLTHGFKIRNRFFPDPGSRIPNPYF